MEDSVPQNYIDVEQIDPLQLPSVSLEERIQLPLMSGIYFAISQDKDILYIGKATCIRKRWEAHHKFVELQRYPDVKIAWLPCLAPEDELSRFEKSCITFFKPSLNVSGMQEECTEKITLYLSWRQLDKLDEMVRGYKRRMRKRTDQNKLMRMMIDKFTLDDILS